MINSQVSVEKEHDQEKLYRISLLYHYKICQKIIIVVHNLANLRVLTSSWEHTNSLLNNDIPLKRSLSVKITMRGPIYHAIFYIGNCKHIKGSTGKQPGKATLFKFSFSLNIHS